MGMKKIDEIALASLWFYKEKKKTLLSIHILAESEEYFIINIDRVESANGQLPRSMNPIPNPIGPDRIRISDKILSESGWRNHYWIRRENPIFLFEYALAFFFNIRERSYRTIGFRQIPIVGSDQIQH